MKKEQGKRRKPRKFLIVVVVLAVLIVAAAAGGIALMTHEYGDRTEILKSSSAQLEKALVVFQPSLTAASHDVAYAIAKGLNDSGYEVKISNPGKHLSADISEYSIVVFGSPNYGSSVAQTLTDYVQQIKDFSGKKVILFSKSGGTEVMPELKKLAALMHNAEPSMVKFQFTEEEKNKASAYQLGVSAAKQ